MKFSDIQKLPWFARALILRPFFGQLGWGSYLGEPTFLSGIGGARIGRRFRVFPGLRLEVLDGAQLLIGDSVAVAQGVHVTCGEKITIGWGCRILPYAVITDMSHGVNGDSPLLAQGTKTKPVEVGDNCMIGAGARILPGVRLGRHCVVGANAVVTSEFPAFSVVVGAPARLIGTLSPDGQRNEDT